jgi:hypothetical protein
MAEECTIEWIMCEEAPTHNTWYCSAITIAKIAHLLWAVTGIMMQHGAARRHVASIRLERGRDVAVNAGDDVDRFLELVHVSANAPRHKDVLGEVVPHPVARIDHD